MIEAMINDGPQREELHTAHATAFDERPSSVRFQYKVDGREDVWIQLQVRELAFDGEHGYHPNSYSIRGIIEPGTDEPAEGHTAYKMYYNSKFREGGIKFIIPGELD